IKPEDVTKLVIGHGHWDHAGQLMDFPNAVLYVQKAELEGIEWALNYPNPHIRAVNTDPGGCARTPACGYPPLTLQEIYGKVLSGKAVIVDGEMEIAPGLIIHPAFRAHTAGSQLLEVHTAIGPLVFGSDSYSSWEGIRDWMIANPQQTDTVQQFLAAFLSAVMLLSPSAARAHNPSAWGGLFRSRDSGVTWFPANAGRFVSGATALAISPTDVNHLLLATDSGLLRSRNGGRDWDL